MIIMVECRAVGGMRIGKGNRITRRKPAPSANFSITNPTRANLRSNLGRGGKLAINRLSYSTAAYKKTDTTVGYCLNEHFIIDMKNL
jgi:hypothetical protein